MIKQGLVLTCTKDSTKNFLDPYPFWNFSGNTKCAGCDTLYAMKFSKGQLLSGPTVSSGKADLQPGYADRRPARGLRGDKTWLKPKKERMPRPTSAASPPSRRSTRTSFGHMP